MTKIEWVKNEDGSQGRSWNPVTGCTKTSPGCKNCYAERMARRLAGRCGYPESPHHFDVTLHPDRLVQPLHRKKPTTYFVCSMSDLFHEDVPFLFVSEVWLIAAGCPQHTFQILTKRPGRMLEYVTELYKQTMAVRPLPNVWLGVSMETPEYSYRATILAEIPAAVRFISFEPLLASFADCPGVLDNMDWGIVGGESGPGARPMDPNWARDIKDQCQAAGVPFFFKQWGAWTPHVVSKWSGIGALPTTIRLVDGGAPFAADSHWMARVGKKAAGRLLDGQEWNQMPRPQ